MNIVDSHAHLSDEKIFPFATEMIERAHKAGVNRIVNICTDSNTLAKGLLLNQKFPCIYNAAAVTPHDVGTPTSELFFGEIEKHVNQLIAIGETGLDYFYEHAPKKAQLDAFLMHLSLAEKHSLPILIHCRDAFSDLIAFVDAHYKGKLLMHCFTGSEKDALACIERGWLISISGIVTFKKSDSLRNIVAAIPLDSLLIETDTPYLSPLSKRGKPNEPAFIVETLAALSAIKKISIEEMAKITTANAHKFFNFDSYLK